MQRTLSRPFAPLGGASRAGLFLAFVLAVGTGVLIFTALQSRADAPAAGDASAGSAATDAGTVLVASRNIAAGKVIEPADLEPRELDREAILPGTLIANTDAVGTVARIPILQGEQIVSAKLTTMGVGTGLPYIVPDGHRAMAIRVDKVIGAGGLLRPGDRVDVFAVMGGSDAPPLLVAQNIGVLAVEQSLERILPGATAAGAEADGTLVDQPEPLPAGTVTTLALTPTDAERVLFAETNGQLRLAVRAPGDTSVLPAERIPALDNQAAVGSGAQLSTLVPQGRRAMAVEVDKVISAGGLLRPGDRVDIIAVVELQPLGGDETIARALTVAQNITVLAVEQVVRDDGPGGAPAAQSEATVATLSLSPFETQNVLLAEEAGEIRLAVRGPGDEEILPLPDSAFFSIVNVARPELIVGETDEAQR